jgi:hypothetical protein
MFPGEGPDSPGCPYLDRLVHEIAPLTSVSDPGELEMSDQIATHQISAVRFHSDLNLGFFSQSRLVGF